MKKTFIFISFLLVSVMFPLKIQAYCTFKDKTKLMRQASNISSTYLFDENSKTFNIILNNIPNQFTIRDTTKEDRYNAINQEINLKGYQPGESYRFEVYSENSDCIFDSLRSIYITLPTYNTNYTNPLCKGLEEYSICQKWGKYIPNQNDFKKEINRIRKAESDQNKKESENEKASILTQFIQIVQKYYYIEIPVIIILLVIVMYKQNKKGKLL